MAATSAAPCSSRASGYLGSIVVNAILLYCVGHVGEWQIGWITPAWSDVVWALSLSLEVSIGANALFLVYDHAWFRYPVLLVSNLVGLQAAYVLCTVFPFDFGSARDAEPAALASVPVVSTVTGFLLTRWALLPTA